MRHVGDHAHNDGRLLNDRLERIARGEGSVSARNDLVCGHFLMLFFDTKEMSWACKQLRRKQSSPHIRKGRSLFWRIRCFDRDVGVKQKRERRSIYTSRKEFEPICLFLQPPSFLGTLQTTIILQAPLDRRFMSRPECARTPYLCKNSMI
jgi:hypothetical protein